jgi:hypothetical protein
VAYRGIGLNDAPSLAGRLGLPVASGPLVQNGNRDYLFSVELVDIDEQPISVWGGGVQGSRTGSDQAPQGWSCRAKAPPGVQAYAGRPVFVLVEGINSHTSKGTPRSPVPFRSRAVQRAYDSPHRSGIATAAGGLKTPHIRAPDRYGQDAADFQQIDSYTIDGLQINNGQ